MRWFEQHRMDWIAETLRVFGFINREHIERKFGISTPQASLDLSRFQELHPNTMVYDASAKRYVANGEVTDLCVVLSEENDRIVDAARGLIAEIFELGTHQQWKGLAEAIGWFKQRVSP